MSGAAAVIAAYRDVRAGQDGPAGQDMLPLTVGPVVTPEMVAAARLVLDTEDELLALCRSKAMRINSAGWRERVLTPAQRRRFLAVEDLGRLVGHPLQVFDAWTAAEALLAAAGADR